ncbi:hypothetical protein HEK616_41140 [Streptomyces nigrescens]|uniref:DUF4352 domain-containing protein n=1 Tax=Streptomyces nigrescens TaxID=1920 RepID=A0ABM7ZW87_STRNI|nr:DUF4352 domain-containing protein [Streptomyces nigrescens]BDM70627.1 hypothetical protein HEK616_41140 [Streptomyces nigrescens]
MRPSIRVATLAVGALVTAVLATGCSSSSDAPKAAPAAAEKAPQAKAKDVADKPSEKPVKAPLVAVGKSGTYTAEDGATGVKTKMEITLKDVKTVTPSEIGTTTKPKGQYVVLTLTVKNVGDKDGGFHPYGLMKWEDDQTAEQNASTLETSNSGQDVDTDYKPGQNVTGDVILDVPRLGGKVNFYDSPGAASLTFELPAD